MPEEMIKMSDVVELLRKVREDEREKIAQLLDAERALYPYTAPNIVAGPPPTVQEIANNNRYRAFETAAKIARESGIEDV